MSSTDPSSPITPLNDPLQSPTSTFSDRLLNAEQEPIFISCWIASFGHISLLFLAFNKYQFRVTDSTFLLVSFFWSKSFNQWFARPSKQYAREL